MNRFASVVLTLTFGAGMCTTAAFRADGADADACGANGGSALQILGSGGPMHGEGRGSAAYLIWFKGRPSILVDAGGGTTVALARAGVGATQIDALLISHFHPDHVSDLPEFLWGEMVADRKHALVIAGPAGAKRFPSLPVFLERQFGPAGAFPDMQEVLSGGAFKLDAISVDTTEARAHDLFQRDGLRVSAYAVPHGSAPALAYRIDGPHFSVVFGGDQTALDPTFSRFAKNAQYLVLHAMLTPRAAGHSLTRVVALPEDLGRRAAEATAKKVVLSHLMSAEPGTDDAHLWSLSSLQTVIEAIGKVYKSDIAVASDLQCFPL